MTLLRALLNTGIPANDAQILEAHFAAEPDFLDGLEQIARCLATGDPPGLIPPTGEPWCSIHTEMLAGRMAYDAAFAQAIAAWPLPAQAAINGAVNVRIKDLQTWLQQNQAQGKHRKSGQYIKALANLGYHFRWNLCTQEVEVNGRRLSDAQMLEIRRKARDTNIWEVNVMEDTYIAEAWANRYHPIKDYLASLKFEGGDPIGQLSSYFQDEHGVFSVWLRRWLVGAVARVMQNTQNRVLVIDSIQGMGKSKFSEWLGSPMPEYFHEGHIQPEDKDCRLRRMSTWIWEVNEIGATTRRADREALKAFITTNTVRERKPYGRYDIQGPAMASFIGTVNNENGILNDPTGNRRYMISHVTMIDWQGYLQNIVIDQVWAQAFDLYVAGEPWELQPDERCLADKINEEYQMVDLVEETLRKHFVIDPTDKVSWMSTVDIIEVMKDPMRGNLKSSEIDTRRLAGALTRIGLEKPILKRVGSKPMRGYYGIRNGP